MKQEIAPIKRTKVINIRVLPDDFTPLQKMADKKGLAVSTYCYLIIKDAIEHEQLKQS